jgi:hypothetical protein
MSDLATQIRTPKVCDLPVSEVAESLAHPKIYTTETVLKAILIFLCSVSRTACTNFKMIMMSTLFFIKPPRRNDVGYEDRKHRSSRSQGYMAFKPVGHI